jgi:hypothetical protein
MPSLSFSLSLSAVQRASARALANQPRIGATPVLVVDAEIPSTNISRESSFDFPDGFCRRDIRQTSAPIRPAVIAAIAAGSRRRAVESSAR